MDLETLWKKLSVKLDSKQLKKIRSIIFKKAVDIDHHNLIVQWLYAQMTDEMLYYYRDMIKKLGYYDIFPIAGTYLIALTEYMVLKFEIRSICVILVSQLNNLVPSYNVKESLNAIVETLKSTTKYAMGSLTARDLSLLQLNFNMPISQNEFDYPRDMAYYKNEYYREYNRELRLRLRKSRKYELIHRKKYFEEIKYPMVLNESEEKIGVTLDFKRRLLNEINLMEHLWDKYDRFGIITFNNESDEKHLDFLFQKNTEYFDVNIKNISANNTRYLKIELISYDKKMNLVATTTLVWSNATFNNLYLYPRFYRKIKAEWMKMYHQPKSFCPIDEKYTQFLKNKGVID